MVFKWEGSLSGISYCLSFKQKTASSNLALPAMTTKQLGNIGEAKTLAKLVSMNVPVSVIMRKQT